MTQLSNGGESSGITTWGESVLYYRRFKKPIHKVLMYWKSQKLNFKTKLRKTYVEVALVYRGIIDIITDIKTYGDIIKERYGKSKIVQFYQQAYLQFILGIRHVNYRVYLLYKEERWEFVDEFTYNHNEVKKDFIEMSAPFSRGIYKDGYDVF